jgi:hypothetical protein
MRQFYLTYRDRESIGDENKMLTQKADKKNATQPPDITVHNEIRQPLAGESIACHFQLSWSHYCLLIRVAKKEAREFYERECALSSWSKRTFLESGAPQVRSLNDSDLCGTNIHSKHHIPSKIETLHTFARYGLCI